jgi:hypothetical protein
MRWVAHGMILNEESFCTRSIASIYDFVDEIVIVEGSTQYSYFSNPYGLSSDNTAPLIREFPDPQGKIKFYQVGWVPSKRELRNMSLRMLTWKSETCVLVLDLDEVWPKESLERADNHFNENPDLHFVHHDLIQLRGDFRHYRDMSTGEQEHNLYNEQSKKQEIHCADGTTLRQGRTAERLFRWTQGMHYVSHTCICDSQGRYVYIDPSYTNYRIWDPDIAFWHYNYMKPFPDVFTKFCYFAQQDANKARNDPEMVERAINEGYIRYLFTGEHPAGAWAVSPLKEGWEHPQIMKSHPNYSKTEKEISDPTGEWLTGDPDMEKIMAMLEAASEFTGPDMNKLVV